MSGIPVMEMNAKSPFLWDWENLAVQTQKKFQFIDSEIEGMEGFEIASLYSSGGTGSDLGYASSSKSSKSASIDSSVEFKMGTNGGFQEDPRNNREMINSGSERTSPTMGSSAAGFGESLIALELGERTYFEDVSAASNAKNSSLPPNSTAKRSKSFPLNADIPRCQVEGCNLDLSSAKDYHRKHKVCENHSKSPKVVINGVERRFCQQCSRFHGLSEFDQKKRSCRRRLSDHNARRRKPKHDVIQFNSMGLPPSLYEGGNQLSFGFGQIQTSHDAWENGTGSKVAIPVKPSLFTAVKSGGSDELHLTQNGLQSLGTKPSRGPTHILSFQGAPSEVFQRGLPVVSMGMELPNNMDAAQDFRALSLLSNTSWGTCNQQLDHSISMMHPNHGSMARALPELPLGGGGPSISSEYWLTEQPVSSSSAAAPHGSSISTSTFQLFKAPNEPPYYLY